MIYLWFCIVSGLSDWEDAGLLAQVLAASQQEYLDSLKKTREIADKAAAAAAAADEENAKSEKRVDNEPCNENNSTSPKNSS